LLLDASQFGGKVFLPVTVQGQLSLAFFQFSAFLILLILYLILYKDVKARYLRLWIAGWIFLTVSGVARLIQQVHDSPVELIVIQTSFFVATTFFLAMVLEYVQPYRHLRSVWMWCVFGGMLDAVMSARGSSTSFLVNWLPALLSGGTSLVAGGILWRSREKKRGHGIPLMAAALLLAGLHHLDQPFWVTYQFYALRIAFGSLLQVALGIGMVVLILEASRARVEDLNDKLRRLSLITAASTQTLSVDEVLQEVLENLVKALGATHGVVRLLTSKGDEAELEIRGATGHSAEFLERHKRISSSEAWARGLLDQKTPWVSFDEKNIPAAPRLRMESENVSAMAFVRLPGKEASLGLLGIGSSTPRRFQADEIAFLTNVANLLGLTIQNLQLFQHAAAAEHQWSYTFDSIGDPILVHDDAGRVVRVNEALASRIGRLPDELCGRMVSEVLRKDGPQWSSCPYCESVLGKGNKTDPGLGGILLVSNSDFHDPSGRRLGVVHVLKDITGRQQAEEKYRSLIANMQEGVFISSPEGRFLDFNDAFRRMLGYESREELMAVTDIASSMYVNPSDRGRLQKLLREHGSVNDFEFQLRRRDGEIVTLIESSVVTRDAAGKIEAFQGFVLDITERKNAEQEIRRRNRELMILNAIGQTLNQPIELQELLGRALRQVVELFSAEAGSIFLFEADSATLRRTVAVGLRSEYARRFPLTELPSDLVEHIRAVHATVLSTAGLRLPAVFRDFQQKEGLEVLHFVVLWSKDRPLGCLLLGGRKVRDFSSAEINLLVSVSNQIAASIEKILLLDETRQAYENLRRTQEQLLQSEKMAAIGQLISGVAHELNNPLTAILGYSQLLSSSEFVNERGADYVGKLYKQARRTHRIVNNLLSFSRQQKPERLPVRINQVIEDTLALREYDLRVNNIHIHRDLAGNLPLTGADAHQLQQVFLNILNNAVDAILERSDRGDIRVRTWQSEGRIVAEFVDSGPGIQDTHRVFDPFYTTKAVGKGTGLGLSICYGIITEHGGEITVDNAPGQGASVTVALPVLPVGGSSSESELEGAGDLPATGRVLLVDDEEAILELEREILVGRRLTVIAVRSGEEAIKLLETEQVDLIVTDMTMPGAVTGRALYEWVRTYRPELAHRVVFTMSGAAGDDSPDLFKQSGCAHIQKPFEVEGFWRVVRNTLVEAESPALKL
jgi:two-component system NtrC family sensor kinase